MLQQEEMSNTIGTKVGIIYKVSISDLNRHATTGRDL